MSFGSLCAWSSPSSSSSLSAWWSFFQASWVTMGLAIMTTLTPTWLWARFNQNFCHLFWNKQIIIYFTWKNEGTDNHQETVDKAERIGKPCEADGAPEGFGDYHNLPSFMRIAENQSLCWVRLGDYCNALVNIVILLSGDYYGDFVFLLFETQNLWFLCLICISTFQVGYDNLVQSGREFVREGCLQKLSRKGYQQRMFFLVSFLSSTFSLCSST